ncbi:gas vesicle structural protein GvpA [Streptomyces mangrovisoli]|uniref:Gas vesicle protein A n=1 Tax=Streptomyces mangrovisoli TaxID=1428628 RepID=A0A1J4P0W1_9ACTN|nr:gas vesicle structural protein GvpA [Streptomyces mangrovisoli]OIJ68369.1 gas vesicle protein [Streptomyces mangrovisoli]
MTVVPQSGGGVNRGGGTGSLYDVLELILDRGLVIDVFVRVSLVGIEILKIDARIVVASVDTYLRFAEACNRLDLESGRKAPTQLTDIVGDTVESGAKGKSKGALSGAAEAVTDTLKGITGRDEDEEEPEEEPEDEEFEEEEDEAKEKEPVERRRRPARRTSRRGRE